MMSDYLIRFSTSHPDIRFDIHEGSTFTLREQLENGVVDITTLRTPIVLTGCLLYTSTKHTKKGFQAKIADNKSGSDSEYKCNLYTFLAVSYTHLYVSCREISGCASWSQRVRICMWQNRK